MPKMSGYIKKFNEEVGDKNNNNKLMSLHMHDDKLLRKYKVIWTEDLKNI